mgnify:CR=1 FL=1
MFIASFYPRRNYYVKKEDIISFVKRQRTMILIVLLAMIAVVGLFISFVSPKMMNLYTEFDTNLPLITQWSSWINWTIMLIAVSFLVYLLVTPLDITTLGKNLMRYKEGEMIRINEVTRYRFELVVLGFMGLIVGYLILSTILPIYSLTSSF